MHIGNCEIPIWLLTALQTYLNSKAHSIKLKLKWYQHHNIQDGKSKQIASRKLPGYFGEEEAFGKIPQQCSCPSSSGTQV